MPHIDGIIHGIAAMAMVVISGLLTEYVRAEFEVLAELTEMTVFLLTDVGDLTISEDVAALVAPLGVLMGAWAFLYAMKRHTG